MPLLTALSQPVPNFNSQPHKEADAGHADSYNLRKNFNSQPHKEADVISLNSTYPTGWISTHSLTRRLTISAAREYA